MDGWSPGRPIPSGKEVVSMFNLGPMELVVILVLALLIFGPGKLPEVGRALGKSLNEFRRASREISSITHEPASRPVAGGDRQPPATGGASAEEGAAGTPSPAPAPSQGDASPGQQTEPPV